MIRDFFNPKHRDLDSRKYCACAVNIIVLILIYSSYHQIRRYNIIIIIIIM